MRPIGVVFIATALLLIGQIHAAPASDTHTILPTSDAVALGSAGCNNRTTWGILWSCATTIFLCTWVSFHPDVPDFRHTKPRAIVVRIITAVMAFLVPEMMVAKAASQWQEARSYTSSFQGWTYTHSYFSLMNGFIGPSLDGLKTAPVSPYIIGTYTPQDHPELLVWASGLKPQSQSLDRSTDNPQIDPSNLEALPLIPTRANTAASGTDRQEALSQDLPSQKKPSQFAPSDYRILVTETEISDRSKSSILAKAITLAETTWFLIQFLERWATHQPRTQIEILTVAYAVLNVLVYILWWNKPYNVDEAIHVSGRAHDSDRRHTLGLKWEPFDILSDAFGSLTDGMHEDYGWYLLPFVGALFGGLHCLAWSFHFPTHAEAVIWRVCALYCTASPLGMLLIMSVLAVLDGCGVETPPVVLFILAFASVLAYVVCRISLVCITFSCLRASPPGVFEATDWTRFFPHIS